MDLATYFEAAFLGLVEGITEFLPVSSTGHILLVGHFLGFENEGKTFEVLIQLGAILAILSIYFGRLWKIAMDLPSSTKARRFVAAILLAFLPAAVLGAFLHDYIKTVLFESPALICSTLIIGGVLLAWIDRLELQPKYTDVMDYPLSLAFKIGLFQCLALVPGVSRSGSTIAGSLLMGTDKRSAAEFSFFLAMPTMTGAFVYDLYKNRDIISMDQAGVIAVGFVMAFIAGLFVVKSLLDFVSRHGFMPFAIWRIVVGILGFIGLAVWG
ncbi:undecaprenyl-diphosphate phosphatase [Cohaesibacter sp. ES.047]|uniref:undecaprenyl-diphosphate phosphatase n=1 Tax=Cohaesibacter sp. ES.047 TaxID=1798205 RepID=UPI000BB68E42|nr:undecaprenyl-diphosphate phosphatase [Cohaesibacter sp. ES.047]